MEISIRSFYVRLARWLIAPALVLAVVLVIVLSTGSARHAVSSSAITQAADVTTRVAGADLQTSINVTVLGQSITMVGGGYESFASRNGLLNLHVSGLPGALSSTAATFQIRFLYPRLFMRSGLFSSLLTPGKSWIELNLAQTLQREGISSSLLSSAGSDPAQYLDYLKAASGGVQKLGTQDIGGVSTTHYHAVVDLRRYAALLPRGQRAAAQQGITRLVALTGTSQVPTDVWVDSHHLVRQERVALSVRHSALPGNGLNEVVTVDLSHFGPKPPVAAPPASQVDNLTGGLPVSGL